VTNPTSDLYAGQISRGLLELDGVSMIGVPVNGLYNFDPDHATVDDIASFEVGPGRLAGTAEVIRTDEAWTLDITGGVTTANHSAVTNRGGVVWAKPGATDADRDLIAFSEDPGGGENPYFPSYLDGVVDYPVQSINVRLDDHEERIEDLEAGQGIELDDPNVWTALQTFQRTVPITDFAAIGATDVTTAVLLRDQNEDPLLVMWAIAVDIGIATIRRSGLGFPERSSADASLTGRWYYQDAFAFGSDVRPRFLIAEGPTIAELSAAPLAPIAVGDPTENTDAATKQYVDGEITANVEDQVEQALSAFTLNEYAGDVATELLGRASITTAPATYADCPVGDQFECPTLIPSPTSSLRIRSLCRLVTLGSSPFFETYSEALDGGGTIDRFEQALWVPGTGWCHLFFEYTEAGTSHEAWLVMQGADPGETDIGTIYAAAAPGIPASTWVEVETELDLTTGAVALRVRTDTSGDHIDTADTPDTRWRTIRTWQRGAATTIENSAVGAEQWIGAGPHGHVARVRRWDDGVLVMDFDAANATDATHVDDAVLESAPGVPAVWTATGAAAIVP
jgi:hypothetical protein